MPTKEDRMSVRHPELCELVDRLAGGAQLRAADRDLLEQYAESEPYRSTTSSTG
jgi:hypothetical protein